jgi:hypothetical protein
MIALGFLKISGRQNMIDRLSQLPVQHNLTFVFVSFSFETFSFELIGPHPSYTILPTVERAVRLMGV